MNKIMTTKAENNPDMTKTSANLGIIKNKNGVIFKFSCKNRIAQKRPTLPKEPAFAIPGESTNFGKTVIPGKCIWYIPHKRLRKTRARRRRPIHHQLFLLLS